MGKPVEQLNSIKSSVLLYIAWKNFMHKKLRTFLTVFGVVIGVGAVFFLFTFGLGVQRLVTNEVIGDQSLKVIEVQSPNSKILKLDESATNTFGLYSNVERIGVQYSFPGILDFKGGEIDSVVYGVNLDYQNVSSLQLIEGRLMEEADSRSVVVNNVLLETLNIKSPRDALNQSIRITIPLEKSDAKSDNISEEFTIVGVIDSGAGVEAFIPSNIFEIAGISSYDQVKVVVNSVENVDTVRKQIESRGFQTNSLIDTLSEINNIFRFLTIILVSFGSIGMVVAVLGMFNTLTISLLERTREIGLMMALGARRRDMRRLFIFEALIVSFVGAVLGIIAAFLAGRVVNLAITLNARSRGVNDSFELFYTPFWGVLAVIVITMLIGLLVVYLPARRAERINPINALRRE